MERGQHTQPGGTATLPAPALHPGAVLLPSLISFPRERVYPSPTLPAHALFYRASYQTTLIKNRAAHFPHTSCLPIVFRAPSSASTRRPSNTPTLQTAHAACSHERLRAVRRPGEQEGTSSRPRGAAAGRQSPSAGGCGVRGAAAQLRRRSALPAGRGAAPNAPPSRSPRRVTHRRERARGSSSAPAPRGPGRRRGRGVPWAAAAGPHRARRRQPQRCGGRDSHGRPGRARSAGSAGPTACVL